MKINETFSNRIIVNEESSYYISDRDFDTLEVTKKSIFCFFFTKFNLFIFQEFDKSLSEIIERLTFFLWYDSGQLNECFRLQLVLII